MSTFITGMGVYKNMVFAQTALLKFLGLIAFFFFRESYSLSLSLPIKSRAPRTLSGGFMAAIYLSGGLLNLMKSLLALEGFAFSVSLCWFFPCSFRGPTISLSLFSLVFKEHCALLNILIQYYAFQHAYKYKYIQTTTCTHTHRRLP